MQKPHKELLRTLITEIRHTLLGWWDDDGRHHRGDLDRELERLGIAPDGTITPLDALRDPSRHERWTRAVAEAQLAGLPQTERAAVRAEIMERAGYTWINRLLALRAMEARGLIEDTLRPNAAYGGLSEALYILRQTEPQRAAGPDGGWWAVLADACFSQADSLPGLFDLDDPNAALRPSLPALLKCVTLVGGGETAGRGGNGGEAGVEGLDEAFRDPDAIGWAYQFYQEESKARTYEKLGSGGKVETRAEIAAVTQLFTEPYMVKWLLQNSLGRSYHELYPDSHLPETWEYYIRRPEDKDQRSKLPGATCLEELTFMDPCMGSGHFEREAFDMLAAMYRERYPAMNATSIADRVLNDHLYGIDIDPRAAQLAALTLYLRAWELVQAERRSKRLPGPGSYHSPALNLATTPGPIPVGALERHLQRHPEDQVYEPLLRGVFAALEQAHLLGSLLKPEEHLDQAIAGFRKQTKGGQYGLLDESDAANQLLEELGKHDPDELKRILLERVERGFAAEAGERTDVGAALFGREAVEGVHLLQLLGQKYAVVATNPPYMGSGNMGSVVKSYVETTYPEGKRDLYAAFILRCLSQASVDGQVALVTLQSYLSIKSYAAIREMLLRTVKFFSIASLGRHAFAEADPPGNPVLAVFNQSVPRHDSTFRGIRIGAPMPAYEQALLLKDLVGTTQPTLSQYINQEVFLSVPENVICFWLSDNSLKLLAGGPRLESIAEPRAGLTTSDSIRFFRFFWELPVKNLEWFPIANAGGYCRWHGLNSERLRWDVGAQVVLASLGNHLPSREYYGMHGVELTQGARGSLSGRIFSGAAFSNSSLAVFPSDKSSTLAIAWLLNSHCLSYFLRAICHKKFGFESGHIRALPIPRNIDGIDEVTGWVVQCKVLENADVMNDSGFAELGHTTNIGTLSEHQLTVEGYLEQILIQRLELQEDAKYIYGDTGYPSGWHPLISGYNTLPDLPAELDLPPLPQEILDYLAQHERIDPGREELARIKANLQALYEAGPGASADDLDLEEMEHVGDNEEMTSGAYIPIPTETFLEELSVRLQIHPISVYWLLEELRAEGVRCKPEEQRLLQDRLTVIVLRLIGHRWPKQIEAGEPVPTWADPDGIIPLTPGSGDTPMAKRVRARLRAEDGPLGNQQAEALLQELTGRSLEEWLRRDFFKRHVSQFKKRPIAWHLASTPTSGSGRRRRSNRQPAFECFVYYHACSGDVLARIRTQYLEPLLAAEQGRVARARSDGDDTAAATAVERIHELEDFAGRLRQVEESGFACADLDRYLDQEPLDRWSGDGVLAPANRAELQTAEQAWHVDINDGVRVNIAPLQQAGLLTSNVLSAKDMRKAIADRARWRSDERRWVREGKLPRCGWLRNDVPESPHWTELAPEREAERQRLEAKRRKLTDNQ